MPFLDETLNHRSPPLNHTDQDHSNRQNQQNMNVPSQRVGRNHSKKPQHEQNYKDSPQQGFVLLILNSSRPVNLDDELS